MNDRNFQILLLIPTFLIVMALMLAINGVRGSDQFWYLADTETLTLNAPAETNARFPGMILRQNNGDPQTYFLHNGPTLLLNASLGRLFGAFNAWKASNLVILVLSALFTALTVSHFSNRTWGVAAFCLFIISPIAVWQAANLLREPFFGLMAAILMYLFTCDDNRNISSRAKWFIVPVLFIGMLSHPLFIILALLYSLYAAFSLKDLYLFTITTLGMAIAVIMKDYWFPSSFQPGISTIIASAVPGKTNMLWQLSDTVDPISVDLLFDKVVLALEIQFANLRYAPMYLLTNAGIASFIILLLARKPQFGRFLTYAFLIIGAYVGIVILMQNQPRYQMISAPVSIACIVILLSKLSDIKLKKYMLAVTIVLLFIVDVVLIQKARQDIKVHNKQISDLRITFENISTEARIAIIGTSVGRYIRFTYALAPRRVLTIDTDVLGAKKINTTVNLFKPDYVIFERDTLFNLKSSDLVPVFMLNQPSMKSQLPVFQFNENLLELLRSPGN